MQHRNVFVLDLIFNFLFSKQHITVIYLLFLIFSMNFHRKNTFFIEKTVKCDTLSEK